MVEGKCINLSVEGRTGISKMMDINEVYTFALFLNVH